MGGVELNNKNTLSFSTVGAEVLRFFAALGGAVVFARFNYWLNDFSLAITLEPLPVGAFLAGVLGGWSGVGGWLLGHAYLEHERCQKTETYTNAWATLMEWCPLPVAYAVLALVAYLVFRYSGEVGRGFPNLRSVAALGIASLVGSLAMALTFVLLGPGELSWDTIIPPTVRNGASILFVAPPLLLLADRFLKSYLVRLPRETHPPRPFPENLPLLAATHQIPMAIRIILLCGLIVVATMVVIPLSQAAPEVGGWPLLGYLGIVLRTALSYGMRGGLFASSISAIAYLATRTYVDREDFPDQGNLYDVGVYVEFATFFVVAVVLGAERAREVRLRQQMLDRERMSELLQSANSDAEAYSVIQKGIRKLFPDERWSLFVFNEAGLLVRVADALDEPEGERVFRADDCWALRLGHFHRVESEDEGALCTHLDAGCEKYICYPLFGKNETLGVLHLALDDPDEIFLQSLARLIALSLGNLKAHQELRDQSIRDTLTGLVNRRYLIEQMDLEVARAGRDGQSISLLIMDIDHFKRFNDTYGHEAGDEVLRAVGRFLAAHARQGDVVCRYGGEEFVMIMPGASLAVGQRRAEEFREGIRKLRPKSGGQSLGQITASFGVAIWPQHGESWKDVLELADFALYEAKKGGRDRVEIAPTPVAA